MDEEKNYLNNISLFLEDLKETIPKKQKEQDQFKQEIEKIIQVFASEIFNHALKEYLHPVLPDAVYYVPESYRVKKVFSGFENRLKLSNEIKRLIHLFNLNINNEKFKIIEDDDPIIDLYGSESYTDSYMRYKIKFPDINSLKSEDF